MNTRQTVFSLIFALSVGLCLGRYSLPSKIQTKTTIKDTTSVKNNLNINKKDNSVVIVTETKRPDGTVTKVTQIQKNTTTSTKDNLQSIDQKNTETDKTITYDTRTVNLSVLAAVRPFKDLNQVIYGGSLNYRIVGAITVGAWGLEDGTLGASIGVSF